MGLREELALRDGPARPRDERERARHDRRERGRAGSTARRREGGHRDQGRTDRRDRAGRQPRHHRRRGPHDRPEHVADPVSRADRHAGRGRFPRAPALAASRSRRAVRRRHDLDHGRIRGTAVADAPDPRSLRTPSREHRAPAVRANRRAGAARVGDRGRRRRAEDPRGLGRLPGGDRRGPPCRRRARHPGVLAHRRPERVVRARGHGRGDRGTGDPRVPRRGVGRGPHPGPHRDRPRAERLLLLHDTDDPLRALDRHRTARYEADRPRGEPGAPRRRGRGSRARPPRHDGGRGAAARPRGDLDRELGLAGDGQDRGDGPANVPARARDEDGGFDPRGGRGPAATTTIGSCATWRRSPRSRLASTGSRTRSVRSPRGGSPTSCCGRRPPSGSSR